MLDKWGNSRYNKLESAFTFRTIIHIMSNNSENTEIISRSERRRRRRRQELIAAAQQIVAQKGIAGLTVLEVTEVADMAVGSFYTYFPSKEALLEAAIWEDLQRLGDPDDLEARGLPLKQIHYIRLLQVFQFFESHRGLMQAVFGPNGSPEQFYRGIRLMERRIKASLQESLSLPDEVAEWMAVLLGGMTAGGIRYLLENPQVSAEEMTQRVLMLLRPLGDYPQLPRAKSPGSKE